MVFYDLKVRIGEAFIIANVVIVISFAFFGTMFIIVPIEEVLGQALTTDILGYMAFVANIVLVMYGMYAFVTRNNK